MKWFDIDITIEIMTSEVNIFSYNRHELQTTYKMILLGGNVFISKLPN